MTVSMECFKSEAKARKRASEIKRLSGDYTVIIRRDGSEWVVSYSKREG